MIAMSALKRAGKGRLMPMVQDRAVALFSGIAAATPAALLLALSLFATNAFAINGTKNIPGDYATLADAITDLNAAGVDGSGVTLNLLAGNAQTAPLGGYAITTLTGSAATPIVIQGNGNTITAPNGQLVGALNDAIFKLIGADYVTLTGFVMTENAANTLTTAASNNMTEWGVALLYASTTDGAQNITIQNNTITLNRTYQNTFGIYANATHSATTIATAATATGAAGGNSNLKIYGNTISNVNLGMTVVGPTAAADQNDGVDIGGTSAGTGNTITNFGTTGTFSGYANVSGTVNGILIRNSKNYNVSFNSITSSSGASGVVAGTLRGIFIPAATNQPIGTFTNTINNNTLAITSHVLGGALQGITVDSTTSSTTSTTNINANSFTALNHTIAAATGATTAISQGGSATAGPLVTSISSNNFTNLTASSTGAFIFISNSYTAPTNGTKNVNGNAIVTGFNRSGVSGAVTFFTDNGSDTAGTVNNFNNNSFTNITLAGTSSIAGIASTNGGAPTKNVNGNTVSGISGGTGTIAAISTGFDAGPTSVSGNSISNLTGGGSVTGLTLATGAGVRTVSKNSIRDLSGTAAASVVTGIAITNNTAGSAITLSNNLVGNLTAPAATGSNAIVGINVSGTATTSTYTLAYNTVYLNNPISGAGFGSSGIFLLGSSTATTSAVNLRNNIVVNTSVQNGAGLTVAYRRSLGTAGALANYASTSNNNDFYAGTPGASNLIYFDGTSSAQTIAAYKAGAFTAGTIAPRDSASVSENPTFVSTIGSNPNFLHISTATATQLESGAAPIAGITDDFDGNARNATTPDIGADEFAGILLDLAPPAISYAPLNNTILTGTRTLTATITDLTGVPTSGAGLPVLYWRVNAGSYVPATATSLGGNQYSFSFGTGVTTGDVVSYYIAAQDTVTPPNVGTSPSAGASGFTANPPAASTPPTTPSSYIISVPVTGSLNVGTAEAFTSLTRNDAQGIFKYLNDNVVTGNVVINLTSDLILEDGAVALNEFAAPFTVTIKPDGGVRNVTGAAASTALIRLNGASRVTFDGSVSGGTDRSLYIENTATTAPTVFRLGSIGNTPIVGNTIKNCTIRNGANTNSAITVTDTAGLLAGYFNNITIQNNDVQKAFRGIFVSAIVSGTNGSGLLITGNSLNTTGVNSIRLNPIFVAGANGVTISNNTLGNISDANAEVPVGIQVSTGTDNAVVSGNTLTSIVSTSTGAASVSGILISAGTASTNIAVSNNTITTLTSAGTAANFYAIGSFSPNVAISDNVISGMTQTGAASGFGIVLVGVNNNVVSGNSVSALTISGGNSVTSGIQSQGASTNVTIERNKVFNIKNTNTVGWGANGIQLASTSAVANTTVRNNFVYDVAAYGFADVTAVDNGYGMIVSSGAGYNIYSNSVLMSTNQTATTGLPAAFNVTSGVTAPGAVNVRNNVFVTTQTIGTQRYSIYSGAPNTVYAAIDYNDYVSAGPNLGFIGSVRATLADIVTGFGGNAASISVDPLFVSTTDLHLQTSPLSPLESAGTPIASVTNDIDNDPRPSTKPDIGADELTSNLTISPSTVAFGNLAVGSTSTELTVTLANTGAGSLDVTTLDAAAAPFARTGTGTCAATLPITIAPGGSCTLTYTFAPTVAGAASQTLTVTSNGPGSGTITLTGTGAQGNLTITPTTVAFGNQLVGSTSAETTVTLANTGNASLTVTAMDAAAAPFAVSGTCGPAPITLAASASCTLVYTFSPTATGAASQTVNVTANAPGSGTIALSGTGIQGSLTITPASVAFGNVAVGSNSGPTAVTLANTGDAPLTVTALTAATAPFSRVGGNCTAAPITIAAGSSCTVAYQFAPTTTGAFNQTVTVTADAPGSGTIALSGTGVQGALTISPTTLTFGNQAVGSTSTAQTVTLANTGGASLQVTALTPAAAPFAQSGGSCGSVPITIAASGSCTLTYTFAPTASGAANQTLTVTANAPGSGTIALSGTGTQGTLTITPTSVNFGTQTIGIPTAESTVTLANTGNASLDVTALTAAAAPFARTATGTCSPTLPIIIAAGNSCTLTYQFTPTATGPAGQTLTVTTDGTGSGTINLSGTGAGVGGVCPTGLPIEITASAGAPGPTGYGTLKAGFDAINGGIHQGNVAVTVCGDTTETATAAINASGTGASLYTAVMVSPANGGARTISGALAAPLVDFNGADNVTIDGLNASGNALTLTNTSTAATVDTATIRFIGGAKGNTVTRTTVLGSSLVPLATAGGTIHFATDAVTPDGNDNNTISFNNIGPAGANLPIKAVSGLGTLTTRQNENSGVVINQNNIYDFFGTGAASVSGVNVLGGNDEWTISNNRIYQTAPRTFTGTVLRYAGITLNSSGSFLGSFVIAGNRIGFGAADGSGTTTISGSTNTFRGIDAPVVDATLPTSIQGNTISGISQSTASTATGTSGPFVALMLGTTGGRFEVGNVSGNTIGSLDGSSTIVVNSTAGTGLVYGIYDFSVSSNTFANNRIGSITIQGAGGTNGFRGILVNTSSTQPTTVTGNTIAGITNTQVSGYSMYGIVTSLPAATVTDNVVRNFVGSANGTGVVMEGISVTAGSATGPSTVVRNTVHSLRNSNAGAAGNSMYAIDLTLGAQANVVAQNHVHSISVNSTFTASQIWGIVLRGTSASTTRVSNNMVRLGFDAAGAAMTTGFAIIGIRDLAGTNVANDYYHNSVYIGGSNVVSPGSNSFAFNSDTVTTARNFQNNIFWNARSNVGTGGTAHVSIRLGGTAANPAGTVSNFNDLLATGNDGVTGVFNLAVVPTLANWRTATGQDANSFADDPQYIAPNGTALTGDLHINPTIATPIEGKGLAIATVTNDFDGDVRAGLTPTDVGADAGDFIPQVGNLTITPAAVPFGNVVVGATSTEETVTLANSGTGSLQVTALSAASTPFARTGTGTCSATLPITIAAGGSCTLTYTFSPTATGPASQTLTVTANAPGSGTIALSGTGIQGNLTITPATIAFGNVAVGSNSGPTAVSLANTGSAPLVITALTDTTAPFSRVGGSCSAVPITIPAGGNCSVAYQFAPTATGAASQTLTVTANAPGSGTITLTGNGTQGALVINPTAVAFGNQGVGTTSTAQTVTLTNTGDASLNVTVLTAASSPFARTGGSCGTAPFAIAAGTSCSLTYTFAPTATGAASQTLTVTSDAPGSGTITLTGNGTQGALVINPTAVAFGNQSVGTTSAASTVTLSNTGDASLNVTVLTPATSPFARSGGSCGTAPFAIAAGASCTLTYTFAPNATGAASQTLTVTANVPGSGTITLSGTGVQGNLVISPTTVNFGSPDILTTTPFMSVTLSNTGAGSLQVTSLTLAAAPFTRTTDGSCGNSLPITIAAGASCTITYTFAPTTAGQQSQTFNVTTTSPGSGSFVLTGTGVSDRIFMNGFDSPL